MDYESVYKTNLEKLDEHPIQVFDAMVELSRKLNLHEGLQKRIKKLLIRGILKIGGTVEHYEDCKDENVEETARNALEHHNLLKNRGIVAACYLRLLPEVGCKWASLPPWRPIIVELLDSVLGNEIYREWKVSADMAHEKVTRLAESVQEQERILFEVIEMLTSFEMMSRHRQKMMACLNSKSGQLSSYHFAKCS